jgi:hypothetical protein
MPVPHISATPICKAPAFSSQGRFTMIVLICVIVILGCLSAGVSPKLINLTTKANVAAVGAWRAH